MASHSSQRIVPETTGTPHSNQSVISDIMAAPHSNQQVVSQAIVSSPNVTNVGVGPLANASNIVLNNPSFYDQAAPDQVASAIKALSERAIDGAEYDSSARDPPPSCHPGTRVQLLEKIKTWFYDKMKKKALLWLSGPAGVGKSAVIQTLAEALAESGSLGATLFFSRLNDRKDPQRVIATVSFQLALRIPAYRAYVVEQITLDPSLLKKGMKEQFRAFVIEPFGNKGIGKGEGPWGILLDGLDECEGVGQQREIVRLVGEFILKFPDVPLVWSISSRPEPHIVAIFTSDAVAPSHWSEYVPIDSTEGCKDVERYLNNGFESMRDQFPHVPLNWPNETQFLKLSNGAKGLFVFARTAVRFMEDPNFANPVARLNLILSVIDHLDVAVTDEHPFALLDALYNHILISIPSTVWPTTKRVLGFFTCSQPRDQRTGNGLSYPLGSRSLVAVSIILNIERHDVYGSLHKLHSVLEIADLKDPVPGISFYHASFGDYLTDPVRSKGFFIDRGESVDDITRGLFRVRLETLSQPNVLKQQFYNVLRENATGVYPQSQSDVVDNYLMRDWFARVFNSEEEYLHSLREDLSSELHADAVTGSYRAVTGEFRSARGRGPFRSEEDRSECLDFLSQADIAVLFSPGSDQSYSFVKWLFRLWDDFAHDLKGRGLFEEVSLRKLKTDHLKDKNHVLVIGQDLVGGLNPPVRAIAFEVFKVALQSLQRQHRQNKAIICGKSAQRRYAFIRYQNAPVKAGDIPHHGFFGFPYPF